MQLSAFFLPNIPESIFDFCLHLNNFSKFFYPNPGPRVLNVKMVNILKVYRCFQAIQFHFFLD